MTRYSERDRMLAAKIDRRPEQLVSHVRALLEGACVISKEDAPGVDKVMGSLKGKISREEFEDYFVHLCRGLQYSFEKFGTSIPHVTLVDQAVKEDGTPLQSGIFF